MSDPVAISIVCNLATIATLVITRWMSRQENKVAAAKIQEIHDATNGMKKQLEEAAYAQGKQDQKDTQNK